MSIISSYLIPSSKEVFKISKMIKVERTKTIYNLQEK